MYKHLESQAAAEDPGQTDIAAEEEALLHGGHQDYPQQLVHAVDNLHESSVISICCWPGDNSRAVTGSGKFVLHNVCNHFHARQKPNKRRARSPGSCASCVPVPQASH